MSDITLNRYLINGTNAERLAFASNPTNISSVGPGAFLLPIWYENDTGNFFAWDQTTTSWIALAGGGGSGITQLTGDVLAGPGSGSQVATLKAAAKIRNIGITIGDGTTLITTGIKGFIQIAYDCTIVANTLLSTDAAGPATSGSIVIDIWKAAYASYPPTVANTITASAKPTLSSANKSTDSTLTGWTTAVTAGDILGFKVDSIATLTRVTLGLKVTV